MKRNRGKQQNKKDQKSFQENWRYQGNVSYKDGHNKERNSKDLTEAEETTKRWQVYKELYTIGLNDPDNHNGVITCLEPGILEHEINQALSSKTYDQREWK